MERNIITPSTQLIGTHSNMKALFEGLPYTKTKAMRPLFANAAKCEPDAQGRIVLPQKLRAYAHLEKDVVVIGVSNRAEIWNAEKWAEIEAEELNPENLAAVMEELGF